MLSSARKLRILWILWLESTLILWLESWILWLESTLLLWLESLETVSTFRWAGWAYWALPPPPSAARSACFFDGGSSSQFNDDARFVARESVCASARMCAA